MEENKEIEKVNEIEEKTLEEDINIDENPKEPETLENKSSQPSLADKIKELSFYQKTTILLALLSLILAICLFNGKSSSKATTYDVTSLVKTYSIKENVKLSLPKDYRLSDEGVVYLVNDETIKALCTMSCVEVSEEDFDGAIEYYKQNLNLEEQESINDFKVGKIVQEQNGISFTYYFLYKDGLFNEFIFTGCNGETMLTILKGFNY